jgi:uncharacterized membrane protein
MTDAPDPKRQRARRANRTMLNLSRRWLRVALIIIGTYAALPFVTPTLMAAGLEAPARALYTLYSPFCHQFAFRSLFLWGDQLAYPRGISGSDLRSYEDYVADLPEFAPDRVVGAFGQIGDIRNAFSPAFQIASREFVGNPQMGYKMTLCARDVAIYTGLFIGGLLYSIPRVRRRLRPVPLWLYVILGLGPIGLDGFSQLLGYPPFNLWPPRETLPHFRVLTGALFGLMNAWLAFPYLEMSFRETREQIEEKFARAGIPT